MILLMSKIYNDFYFIIQTINMHQSVTYFNFRCLEKNPEHRPFMMELEEHPFIQSVPENDFHVI